MLGKNFQGITDACWLANDELRRFKIAGDGNIVYGRA